jgi:hypothetical protein
MIKRTLTSIATLALIAGTVHAQLGMDSPAKPPSRRPSPRASKP